MLAMNRGIDPHLRRHIPDRPAVVKHGLMPCFKASRGPAAATRAAAPPEGSV